MEEGIGLSKPDSVYEKLRSEILYLELEPGQMIGEIETAKRFGVSRTPVRDAFKRLEYEGLLEIRPHIGTFVSLIDLDHITDILYMREKLELSVIRDFVGDTSQIKEFRLDFILTKQKQLFEQHLPEKKLAKEFILSDNEFHRTIFELSGKETVWNYLSSFEHHYKRFRMFLNLSDKDFLHGLYEEHRKILELIRSKDLPTLEALFSNHLYGGIHRGVSRIYEKPAYFKDVTVE